MEISENDYCRKLLADSTFEFPKFLELRDGFQKQPKLIESWLKYSEDRRSSPSFYFLRSGRSYEIGYVSKFGVEKIGKYQEACFACALFVKLELEHRILNLSLAREKGSKPF